VAETVTPDDGLVGEILPPTDASDKPMFRRLLYWERADRQRARGTCKHPTFVIDDEARTLECGECGERVDPFDVVLQWERVESHFRQRREWEAERKLRELRADLRALRDRKLVTPEEKNRIEQTLRASYADAAKLRATFTEIDAERNRRRWIARGYEPSRNTEGVIVGWSKAARRAAAPTQEPER
jgi:hypothetical protein